MEATQRTVTKPYAGTVLFPVLDVPANLNVTPVPVIDCVDAELLNITKFCPDVIAVEVLITIPPLVISIYFPLSDERTE